MNLRPLENRLIVRPAKAEEKTKGGIIVPETAKDKPLRGEIVAAGPGKVSESGELIPTRVKVGDTILYGKYTGAEIKAVVEGAEEDLIIMRETDVFAVIE